MSRLVYLLNGPNLDALALEFIGQAIAQAK